jgi:hypothetical protein
VKTRAFVMRPECALTEEFRLSHPRRTMHIVVPLRMRYTSCCTRPRNTAALPQSRERQGVCHAAFPISSSDVPFTGRPFLLMVPSRALCGSLLVINGEQSAAAVTGLAALNVAQARTRHLSPDVDLPIGYGWEGELDGSGTTRCRARPKLRQ